MARKAGTVRRCTAAIALFVALLGTATPAQALTFGANLSRRANNTASCQNLVLFQRVSSCSWTTSGSLASRRESMIVPGRGRIVRVWVKVGNRTGPMRFAILQSLRRENSGEAACCIGRRQTGIVTPPRNRTTSYAVNLPVSVGFNRISRIYHFDALFLTMVNSSTPIPAHTTGTGNGNCSGGWFPAVRPGQENFTGPYGVCGATILIRGDWRPA